MMSYVMSPDASPAGGDHVTLIHPGSPSTITVSIPVMCPAEGPVDVRTSIESDNKVSLVEGHCSLARTKNRVFFVNI